MEVRGAIEDEEVRQVVEQAAVKKSREKQKVSFKGVEVSLSTFFLVLIFFIIALLLAITAMQ